ncbi:MAG: ATPase, T2SS/T4P/T4SS family, partial [Planctomycetota bacterium]
MINAVPGLCVLLGLRKCLSRPDLTGIETPNMNVSGFKNNRYDNKPQARDVVSLVDDLLDKATQSGASDVHFEPTAGELVVKFRLDGVLGTFERLPKAISDNVI